MYVPKKLFGIKLYICVITIVSQQILKHNKKTEH